MNLAPLLSECADVYLELSKDLLSRETYDAFVLIWDHFGKGMHGIDGIHFLLGQIISFGMNRIVFCSFFPRVTEYTEYSLFLFYLQQNIVYSE